MTFLILGDFINALLGWFVSFLSVFLVMLVLIQRGKGGGLTGALGGPGGQSAFGSKAGDTFTAITIVVASIWGFTCAFMKWKSGTPVAIPVADATLEAGPGDTAPSTEMSLDDILGSGEGGIGGTPSADLVPADGAGSADDATDDAQGDDATADDDSEASTDTTAADSGSDAADSSEGDADSTATDDADDADTSDDEN